MTRRACILLIAVAALPAVTASGALACGRLMTDAGISARWDLDGERLSLPNLNASTGAVVYVLDVAGCPDISDGSEFTAAQAAFDTWAAVTTARVAFERAPNAAVTVEYMDSQNVVVWNAGTLGPGIYAVTYTTYYNGGANEGLIIDADIEMNADVTWGTQTPGTVGEADVQAIIAHEIGHVLGFDHTPVGRATLYYASAAGSIYNRTLEEDDVAAVSALYPGSSYEGSFASILGRVNRSGIPTFGAWILALNTQDQRLSAGAITGRDGAYHIRGLPPGTYWLLAAPAVPSQLSDYFSTADTTFSAQVHPGVLVPGAPRSITLFAGEERGADFELTAVANPLEIDGTPSHATDMVFGQAAVAAIETLGDNDYFKFPGQAGDVLVAGVIAYGAGSDLDPYLRLYDSTGTVLLVGNDDIVPHTGGNLTSLPGPDYDARIASFTLPVTSTYYLRVTDSPLAPSSGLYCIYLLNAAAAGDVDPLDSEFRVVPNTMPADGKAQVDVWVIPKNPLGQPLGAGLTVAVSVVGPGDVSAVTDLGDGRYTACLTAPSMPGAAYLRASVDPGAGQVFLTAEPNVTYREVEKDDGCGCAPGIGDHARTVLGAIFPFLILFGIIALLRLGRRFPAPGRASFPWRKVT
jgi:hypothetical protein